MIKTLTEAGLIELLDSTSRAEFVTLQTKTKPDMNKTGNPYYDKVAKDFTIRKISSVNGIVHWSYSNAVNNQREREGWNQEEFEPQARTWGERLSAKSCIIAHKGKDGILRHYLEMKVEKTLGHNYVSLQGTLLNKADIQPFLNMHVQPATQETLKEIFLRDYRLDSIKAITLRGTDYVIA